MREQWPLLPLQNTAAAHAGVDAELPDRPALGLATAASGPELAPDALFAAGGQGLKQAIRGGRAARGTRVPALAMQADVMRGARSRLGGLRGEGEDGGEAKTLDIDFIP